MNKNMFRPSGICIGPDSGFADGHRRGSSEGRRWRNIRRILRQKRKKKR